MGHVPRVSHVTGIFTQLWGTMQLMSPQRKLWGTCPLSPAGFTPLKFSVYNAADSSCLIAWKITVKS